MVHFLDYSGGADPDTIDADDGRRNRAAEATISSNAEANMDDAQTGQVTRSAADVYDEFFLPALFAQWAGPVADAAAIGAGHRVLDVACGTGVLACEAEQRVAPGGAVVGLDRNDGMLTVARRKSATIDWQVGMAEALPFTDGGFDAVVSQFALMFFEDRTAALKEMWRVLKPDGRLAVAVWDTVENAPGYTGMVAILQDLFGDAAADALRAPYTLGDTKTLKSVFDEAGIDGIDGIGIATRDGVAQFPSIASWVHTDVKGWTLADMIDDAQYATLLAAAEERLQDFVVDGAAVRFSHPAHIVTATKA